MVQFSLYVHRDGLKPHSFNFSGDIPWHEPMMDENCWAHSMLSTEYQFAPNCNTDGSYGPKQCFLER